MPVGGRRPKPPGQAVTRNPRLYGWTEVENTCNMSGPRLPPRRRNGQAWPAYVRARWDAWRRIPHAARWQPSDWEIALDTIDLVARAAEDDGPVSLISEIRLRERTLGTTSDARLSQRIRYIALTTDDGPVARG